MCIGAFVWQTNRKYPLIVVLNRDEYHNRLTIPLSWWRSSGSDGDDNNDYSCILGGRDGVAGGTWLGCNKLGKLAFLTNVRQFPPQSSSTNHSRGHLPIRFLQSKKDARGFAEEVAGEARLYNGFNLIVADLCSNTMLYITNTTTPTTTTNNNSNTPKQGAYITPVSPGIHVLSNASLDTPWPKAQRLEHLFSNFLDSYVSGECSTAEFVDKLMRNTVKDDEILLPGIYPPEMERQLSSIYVEAETPQGRYGTRSTSVVSVNTNGEVSFFETHLQENDLWKDQTVTYQIENMR